MTAQRKFTKKDKTIHKNKIHRYKSKKNAFPKVWYYKPWNVFLYQDLLFDADGFRYVDYLRAREELRQPHAKKTNMLEVPDT